ncbi:MAG TPA: hypothetical protein VEH86_07350 [Candidatus Acidoferrum sp.]|nr:hypothetical protein [Candidatus Acidoferrum sp.]
MEDRNRGSSTSTPVRRLEGITYWVISDPTAIYDFVNSQVRKEWERDARSEHRDPKDDPWLMTLARRKWHLEILDMTRIKLDPEIMNYADHERGYVFSRSLEKRSAELRHNLEAGAVVLSPLIVREEDYQLVDGYCRYTTLKAMNVPRTYTYVGSL